MTGYRLLLCATPGSQDERAIHGHCGLESAGRAEASIAGDGPLHHASLDWMATPIGAIRCGHADTFAMISHGSSEGEMKRWTKAPPKILSSVRVQGKLQLITSHC